MKQEKGNIALAQWLRFCRDFNLVPKKIPQQEVTQIFHRCNLRIGDGVVRPLCSFPEFLAAVRVLARAFDPADDVVVTNAAGVPDDEAGHAQSLVRFLQVSAHKAHARKAHAQRTCGARNISTHAKHMRKAHAQRTRARAT